MLSANVFAAQGHRRVHSSTVHPWCATRAPVRVPVVLSTGSHVQKHYTNNILVYPCCGLRCLIQFQSWAALTARTCARLYGGSSGAWLRRNADVHEKPNAPFDISVCLCVRHVRMTAMSCAAASESCSLLLVAGRPEPPLPFAV